MRRREFLATAAAAVVLPVSKMAEAASERHLLYIAEPGIRNYVEYGGVGVLVYDIGAAYKFVKRIPTWTVPAGQEPENVKGVAASAKTGRIFVTTIKRLCAIDLVTEKMVWEAAPDGGCDRLAISPDGTTLYVPSLEGPHWNVIERAGRQHHQEDRHGLRRAQHRVLAWTAAAPTSPGCTRRCCRWPTRRRTPSSQTVGPFGNVIRPFTVNGGADACLRQRQRAARLRDRRHHDRQGAASGRGQGIREGPGQAARLPEPRRRTHARTRSELWLCDGHNNAVHVFDNTVMPPKQMPTHQAFAISPGWVTFSIDGKHAYPSTGEVFDTRSKKLIASLQDEQGRQIGSEKLLEIVFDGTKPVKTGDQFGLGGKTVKS